MSELESLSLAEKIARVRELTNTSSKSEDKTPTPLWVFLHLYNKASHECYISYMEGAKLLADYLAPIEIPIYFKDRPQLPDVLCSYKTQELAKILNTTQDIILYTIWEDIYYE